MHPAFESKVVEETATTRIMMNGDGLLAEVPKDGHDTIPHYIKASIVTPEDWKRVKAERFRRDIAREWLERELPPSVGRTIIHVEFSGAEDSGLTWAIDSPGRQYHKLWLGISSPETLDPLLAHEIAHIKHRDVLISTIAAVMAGVISYAGYMLMFFGGGQRSESPLGAIGALAMIMLAPIGAMVIQLAISRSREYAADSYAGELTGNPLALAAALDRLQSRNERIPTDSNPAFHSVFIVQPLSAGETLRSWFSTHPPTEKRIAALRRQAADLTRRGDTPRGIRRAG